MRWFFLLLLVLNLFYYVWHQQQAPLRVKEVESFSLYQGARQNIRLVSEADVARMPAGSSPVAAATSAARSCWRRAIVTPASPRPRPSNCRLR